MFYPVLRVIHCEVSPCLFIFPQTSGGTKCCGKMINHIPLVCLSFSIVFFLKPDERWRAENGFKRHVFTGQKNNWEGESHREEVHKSAFLLILRDSESEWRQHRSSQLIRTRCSPRWGQADVDSFRIENLPPVPHQWLPCQQLCNIQLLYRIRHLARSETFSITVIRLLTQNWKSEREERREEVWIISHGNWSGSCWRAL